MLAAATLQKQPVGSLPTKLRLQICWTSQGCEHSLETTVTLYLVQSVHWNLSGLQNHKQLS